MDLLVFLVPVAFLIGLATGYAITVPTIVDRVRYVDRPIRVERIVDRPAPVPPSAPTAAVVFMDVHERKTVATATLDAKARRPTVHWRGRKYQCARQDTDGRWVYRQVAH